MVEEEILNRRVRGGFAEGAEIGLRHSFKRISVGAIRAKGAEIVRWEPSILWGGNVVWFGLWAQMELSFGYLSRLGDGCYTRELWQ